MFEKVPSSPETPPEAAAPPPETPPEAPSESPPGSATETTRSETESETHSVDPSEALVLRRTESSETDTGEQRFTEPGQTETDTRERTAPEAEPERSASEARQEANEQGESGSQERMYSAEELDGMNLYERLGISPDASEKEIRSAYRAAARQYHPDRHAAEGVDTSKQFHAIQDAYEVLNDPRRRAAYRFGQKKWESQGDGSSSKGASTGASQERRTRTTDTSGPDWWKTRSTTTDRSYSAPDDPGWWKARQAEGGASRSSSGGARFYAGTRSGWVYERRFAQEERDSGFVGFFSEGFGVIKVGSEFFIVDTEGFAVSTPYEALFRLGIYRIAQSEEFVYLLNELAEELSAPYESFRLEGDVLIGVAGGYEYVINTKDGTPMSAPFQKISFNVQSRTLTGTVGSLQFELDPDNGRIRRPPEAS